MAYQTVAAGMGLGMLSLHKISPFHHRETDWSRIGCQLIQQFLILIVSVVIICLRSASASGKLYPQTPCRGFALEPYCGTSRPLDYTTAAPPPAK